MLVDLDKQDITDLITQQCKRIFNSRHQTLIRYLKRMEYGSLVGSAWFYEMELNYRRLDELTVAELVVVFHTVKASFNLSH